MSAIIEEAKRTTVYDILGGDIARALLEWFGGQTLGQPSNHRSQLFDALMLANRTIRIGPR